MSRVLRASLRVAASRTLVRRGAAAGALVAAALALLLLAACSDHPTAPAPPQLPDVSPLVALSAPISPAGGGVVDVVYVSLPPGSVPGGESATVTNLATSQAMSVPMVEGGFDPVPLPATVGNELTLEIHDRAGNVIARATLKVGRRTALTVVRTDPPKGKTDVPVNGRILVVFDEPVSAATVAGAVQLFRGSERVSGTVTLAPPGLVAEFLPDAPLAPHTAYELVVTTAVHTVSGDPLGGEARIPFTTGAGPRIAFVSDRDGTPQLYVVNLDGSGLTRLTHDTASYGRPAWSPDARQIAVERFGQGIVVMNANGTGATLVAPGGSYPAWSPDGTRIRFAKFAQPPEGSLPTVIVGTQAEIDEATADGAQTTRLCTGEFGARMAWSPDLRTAAFEMTDTTGLGGDAFTQLYLNDEHCTGARGFPVRFPVPGESAEGAAAWSPDGKRIAFWSFLLGIATITPDSSGSPTTVFSDFPSVNFWTVLSWSPDGKYLALVSDSPTGRALGITAADSIGAPPPNGVVGTRGWDPAWAPR